MTPLPTLEERVTRLEHVVSEVLTKPSADKQFTVLNDKVNRLTTDVASLRGQVLSLDTEMSEVQETLSDVQATLQIHGEKIDALDTKVDLILTRLEPKVDLILSRLDQN